MKHSPTGRSDERRPRVGDRAYVNLIAWNIAHVAVKKRIAALSRVPAGMQRGIRMNVSWDSLRWNEEAGSWDVKERRHA